MKKTFTTFLFAFILVLNQTHAQVGTTIQITDGLGSCTLDYDGVQNGKYRYKGFGCQTGLPVVGIIVFWNFTNWEIRRIDDRPSYFATAYISTVETNLNPPDLSIGNWVAQSGGFNLTEFSGTGTTNIPCLGTPSFTAGATSLCTGATSTYTATATNVQTTAYSIVGGTGATINASTGVVSNVTGNFTVRATLTGSCGASKTVDRLVSYNCGDNNALLFDGVDDYVACGNPTAFQVTSGTIETWVKPSVSPTMNGYKTIVAKQDIFGLYLANGELIAFDYLGNGNINTGVYLNANQWYHVAMSFDGNAPDGVKVYIDGVLKVTGQRLGLYNNINTNWYIGIDNPTTTSQYINATIDEVRFWNVVRSQAEIQASMNLELNSGTGLVAAYHFNQGVAGGNNAGVTTLNDALGNNNGTLNGFALTGSTSNWVAGASAVVLPVELLSFTGKNTEGGNLLTWQTANETNNKGFEIERQKTANDSWETLGFVASKSSKETANVYSFRDIAPHSMSYYRLKQLDNDGQFTYSKTIAVQSFSKKGLKLYPSVSTGILNIETTETDADFHIINLLGQSVMGGKTKQTLDVSALPKGTYFLKIGIEQVKFIKQ